MIVGAWRWPQYEDAFAKGLEAAGVTALRFSTMNFFRGWAGRAQLAWPMPGPSLLRLNRSLIRAIQNHAPDTVLFWRPTHVLPSSVAAIKSQGIRTLSYNNDDPFGHRIHNKAPWSHLMLWHWYLRCLPIFDRNYFYRRANCGEAIATGATHAEVMLPYFMPWQDRPVALSPKEVHRFSTEAVFVGHYEPDGREQSIHALVHAGITVKIWSGHSWNRTVLADLYPKMSPISPALGEDYAKALCGAKVCLCFLSKLNRDTYTRRCFEIPACGRAMLAERTDDLLNMFKEDEEACFFSSNEELVAKAKWLLANPDIRERIAQAGLRRVWADGHDVNSRARTFVDALKVTH
jgi:hypothetical protein